MSRAAASVLALALVLAGCLGGGRDGGDAPSGAAGTGTSSDMPGNGTSPDTPARANAPAWNVGDTWTWRLSSSALTQEVEATTVVLAADGSGYDVGAATIADGAALLPFHLTALGAVDAACLCWEAHGSPVQLLRFPIEGNQSFTADFWSAPGAQVTVVPAEVAGPDGLEAGYRSTVTYAAGGVFLEADYAPARGQFVRVASHFGAPEPFAQASLVRAGTGGSDGAVAFRATELARYTASGADPSSVAPRALTVPADADVILLGCFLPGSPGPYFANLDHPGVPIGCGAVSATQTTYVGTTTPTQAGPATVTAAAGGQGAMNVEVFAIDTTP